MVAASAAGSLAATRPWIALCAVVAASAAVSGWLAHGREAAVADAPLPGGTVVVAARVVTDPAVRWGTLQAAARPSHLLAAGTWEAWDGPLLRIDPGGTVLEAGDRIVAKGSILRSPGFVRGAPVAGTLRARSLRRVGGPPDPLFAAGNALRDRVGDGIEPFLPRPAAGLLAGFLIGDVSDLPAADHDALRRTGLTHFVAVSGSNVALFLAAWWVAMGPLGWSPRLRAVVGLAGLLLFVVVTRWEPSVVRAATMAALVLGGRLAGVPVGGWAAFGGAVTVLLLVSGELAFDAGFQLSAAATAGVMAGVGLWRDRRPRWVWAALGATAAAQVAVAPLLLAHFGSLPLLAPLANLVAAPLVAFSTAMGGIGVTVGAPPVTAIGVAAAEAVLAVARSLQDLPQVGWAGLSAVVAGLGLAAWRPRLRAWLAAGAAAALAVSVVVPGLPPGGPEMVVLDVGQGDAILLRDPAGAVVLFDGGPDPGVLRRALSSRRIGRIDLLVLTHSHADHAGGLVGITERATVQRAWVAPGAAGDPPASLVVEELEDHGTVVEYPGPGAEAVVGSFHLEVLGPLRRYALPNDGSLVVMVRSSGASVLLAGDIEAIAQREIGATRADVLKVPHQGAATSDLEWLAAVGARVAVISVGPNSFGHPSAEVIAALEAAGGRVLRTDLMGDVVIRLDRLEAVRRVLRRRYGGGDEARPRRRRPP